MNLNHSTIYASGMKTENDQICIVCGAPSDPIEIPPLPSLGIPAKLLPSEICNQCRDAQAAQADSKRQEALFFERKANSGIPKRFFGATIESYMPTERTRMAYSAISSYRPARESLFVFGPPGTGKTHLAIGILNEWLKGQSGIFISVPDFIIQVKKSFFNGGYFQFTEKMQQVPLLVLDDIGAERLTKDEEKTAFVRETLYSLINSRYQNQKPTIFTSNFNKKELELKLGAPIISRIVEMARVIHLKDEDYRYKIRKRLRIVDNHNY